MKIYIDPGHGGTDSGAVANKIIEKKINLAVALTVRDILKEKGHIVGMSRDKDITVELTTRTNAANKWGADLLVSIHHNAGGGIGYEVIHTFNPLSKGVTLAKSIAAEFSKTGQKCRRVFSRKNSAGTADYYHMIRNSKMPAVITEFAFLDTIDYKNVDTQEELLREAKAIATGILNFIGGKK